MIKDFIEKSRAKSPWMVHFDCGSCNGCDIETLACLTPIYDVERFGVVNVGNPKHADILMVTGAVNHRNKHALKKIYDQMPNPKAVVAIGACATFGGIPAAKPNPTKAKKVTDLLPGATVINIPGCPSHPDWIVGTVAHVLLFGIPELDEHLRPKMFFGRSLHEQCERRADFDEGNYAKFFGDKGCLYELGCKGPDAMCDASIRQWNSKVSWCVRAGGACIGCVEPTFPDHDGDGLYVKKPYDRLRELPGYKGTRRSREA